MSRLTPKQRRVLEAIREYVRKEGTSPSYKELADTLGVAVATVYGHVQQLELKGRLIRLPGSRGIELVGPDDVACPRAATGYVLPPGARWVPVSVLPGAISSVADSASASGGTGCK